MTTGRIYAVSSQYLQLTTNIAEIEWVESQLPEQTNYLQDLQLKVAVKRSELDKLRKQTYLFSIPSNLPKKEFKEVQDLKHFTVKRLTAQLTHKLEKKLKKEETDYLAAFEKEQNEKTALEMLENELQEANQMVFTGSIPGNENALINALESEVNILYTQFNQVSIDVNRYQSAEKHIGNARNLLSQAIKSLRQALGYNSWDRHSNSRIANFFEQGSLADARNYSMQAQVQIDQARQYVPEIHQINVTQGTFVLGVLFDNFFVDLYIRTKIEASIRSLTNQSMQLDGIYRWLQNNISNFSNIYKQMERAYFSKRKELSKERIKIFERVLRQDNATNPIQSSNASNMSTDILESNNDEDDALPSYDEALRQPSVM
ncbi:11363_t:CDS:2 [Scutellospora calospora]|uniref:11363_t:CDS:1 n=1 Tax=Scutellospora calospora TaxID=85575 RepID=A0ACA9K4C2_9GLOM|nr:11363_t:CDS:2 [Scutellospora calospora]